MPDPSNRSEPQNPIDPAAAAIIRRKAARMVGRAGLRPQDRPDLEQELTLHVLRRRARFNRRRGTWSAFVGRVVERYGENLVRARRRAWRAVGPFEPLPDEVPDPGGDDEVRARAVAAALGALPPDLRRVAEAVLGSTIAAAARELGVSRSTVYARLREIRARTEFAELRDNP